MQISFLETLINSAVQSLNISALTRIHLSKRARAITLVLLLLGLSFVAGAIAFFTSHAYFPLALLGIFYGVILSYPATKLLGPKLQAALGGLLGGITLGNISSKVASVRSGVLALSKFITATVQQTIGADMSGNPKTPYIEAAVVYCIWMTIITMSLIVAISAYLEEGLSVTAPEPAAGPPPESKPKVTGAAG